MDIFNELYKFSPEFIFLGDEIKDNRLEKFEEKIDYKLPDDFKKTLKKHNGISLFGTKIYGLDEMFRELSIDKVYDFEHNVVSNKMFKSLIPFSSDGRGNHYCLNLVDKNANEYNIVFWQSDCFYETVKDIEVCNDNFTDWVEEVMIEWNLEMFNYDGTEK